MGETFNITIDIKQAENVYSWQFKLSWDPTVLEVEDVQEGDFLKQGIYKTQFQEYVYNEAGNLVVVCFFLGEPRASSASGDGTLATVTFHVKDTGYTTLLLYDTELLDYDIIQLLHTSDDGFFLPARFTYTPTIPLVGEATTFNASVSSDVDKDVISYQWIFDDGNISSTVNSIIVHAYEFVGTFNVTLTVFYSGGSNSSHSQMVSVMMPTYISILTSSSSKYVGYGLNVTGTLCDTYGNGLENETVILSYTFVGIGTWTPITSDITNSLGQYFAVWIPSATGYFTLKAEWAGNTTHFGTNNTVALSRLPYNNQYVFSVESNSTISELAFNTTDWTLSFNATGSNGTRGYVKVTVAKSLVENIANIRVYMDGRQLFFSVTSLDDSWLLAFNYIHSSHQVVLDLDINIIPEFSSFLIMLLFMIATLVAVIFYKENCNTRYSLKQTIKNQLNVYSDSMRRKTPHRKKDKV